ncbi:MAG: DNA translocase FtsK [Ruminococcaceae bacterium]|nr:DNA translocase FtsK [Oscillospiraceae bacterium]
MSGIITIAIGLLFGVCLYTVYAGSIGEAVKYLLLGLFGAPVMSLPVFIAGCGLYLMIKRDYNRMYIKLSLSLIIILCFSVLWQSFGMKGENASLFEAFELANRTLSGGGIFGALIANPLIEWFGVWICAIVFITITFILLMFLFKISPIRVIAGFLNGAKREAREIQNERSYEIGQRAGGAITHAAKTVDDRLRPLRQRSIDIDVDTDTGEITQKKKRKTRRADIEEAIGTDEAIVHNQADDAELDVPVFDAITKKMNTPEPEEIISASELLGADDGETVLDNTDGTENIAEQPDAPHGADASGQKPKRVERLTAAQEANLREQLDDNMKAIPIPYKYPPTSLLAPGKAKRGIDSREELRETAVRLVDTLKSFGVDVKLLQVSRGPTVTRYELQPSVGVKVSKITNLSDDIALNLAASAVRIEAPIPGKAAIGIEVPNKEVASVALRDVIESDEFKMAKSKLSIAFGMDIAGKAIIGDIGKMPHVLIAGATGSGKSVCINSIITSILYKADPNEVKLIMVDPKVVELGVYNGIPHLLVPVVTDPKKASGALGWAVSEMTRRYNLFAESGVRDLSGYNEVLELDGEPKLPQIVIIIDELSDLMMVAPKEIEDSICRLAQMARAAGMHLIIATQRPSVNVITGVIKANIPSRIAFAVSSHIDSRTILDSAGAEKLLGKGDMLFMPMGASKPTRIQGAFISDKEVERIVEFIKDTSQVRYDEDISEKINSSVGGGVEAEDTDCDELLPKAIEIALAAGSISTSMVQRRLGVGYARAGRIIDQMEARGIISGADGSKPRNVLVSAEDLM